MIECGSNFLRLSKHLLWRSMSAFSVFEICAGLAELINLFCVHPYFLRFLPHPNNFVGLFFGESI